MLRVSFIGSGNVATRFAARLRELGAEIVQICSRSKTPVSELDPDLADVVIVAVSDDAIAQIVNKIPSAGSALWLHTAGSVGLDVFNPAKFPRRGVLYPLQTMLKDRPADWENVPLLVEGDPQAGEIARSMSPLVAEVSSADRRRLHAAAVIGCNMVMYLWSLSERICNEAGLDFNMLRPLFGLTGTRVMEMSPSDAMTGPAKRGDIQTIQKHIDALPADIADTYAHLSAKMLSHFHPTLPTAHSPLPTKKMIPYDLTRLRAFVFDVDGVLSPNMVPIDADGAPARMANVKDGYALHLAVKRGYKIAIITGGDTMAVHRRYSLLGIKDIYLGAGEKLPVLTEWMAANGLSPEEVAYCGDDVPDLLCMRHCALSIAPADASPDAKDAAKYVTAIAGGHGVARELIEQTLRAQDQWPDNDEAYGW